MYCIVMYCHGNVSYQVCIVRTLYLLCICCVFDQYIPNTNAYVYS